MRIPRARAAIAALSLVVLAGACGDGTATSEPTAETATGGVSERATATATAEATAPAAAEEPDTAATDVAVVDFAFEPAGVTVAPGTPIVWSNEGDISHTVTFSDGGPDSGTMAAGDTFEHTFEEPGSYRYLCRFHGQMQGTVEVG